MGLAAGCLKYALGLLAQTKKLTSDAGTQAACDNRINIIKENYNEAALQMKSVYYESESSADAI